ncbi:V-set and immunoglobulin domain-containing protein 10-like [Thalassophryne amazonica]|uniref:V-set and immunoglobulin domain-containing protein 10-like n=1 Tax=Thalassophryne amazonica TaxID=390379 RepID=UPI001471163E|nr:V-set and immunoglobulin domain-containing protein 10-like [Thalassophryne amazonica]
MLRLEQCEQLSPVLLVMLSVTFEGVYCVLGVSPVGPSRVSAIAGTNVTLSVVFIGTNDPQLTWFMGNLPVATWTVGSSAVPVIADTQKAVLKLQPSGSLTFVNVPLNGYNNNYTIEIIKSGVGTASTIFTLKVFEIIHSVTLTCDPSDVTEGSGNFTINYNLLQAQEVIEQQMWSFNGVQIKFNSHYSVQQMSLVVYAPNRNDTGNYTLLLTNPFSSVTAYMYISVLYGPDVPIIEVTPSRPFYESGASLSLFCQSEGFPQPTINWVFGGRSLSSSHEGILNLTNIKTNQGGTYTCTVTNERTGAQQQQSIIINIYESPLGNPVCSVNSVNKTELQYLCQWSGGTPPAQLYFPALSNSSSAAGILSLTVTTEPDLNRKTVTCIADHPVKTNKCSITASRPGDFLPAFRTTVNMNGKIEITIECFSEASPKAVVLWSVGNELIINGTTYEISTNTTQLIFRTYNISKFLLKNYTCICHNPLGIQKRQIQIQGPSISDSSLFSNPDGTVITLTWEVPPTSVVTGFDIQMKGPKLLSEERNDNPTKRSSDGFRSIQQRPGSDRSTDIFTLDPKSTYMFRIFPRAGVIEGEPSRIQRTGPGEGLNGPAIPGIAAGIPCSLLFLLLLCGTIFLCASASKKKYRQTQYPRSRPVEKTSTQTDITPHKLLSGGLNSIPDYNRLHQTPSERSMPLPMFVPPPPVRVATRV